MISLLIESAVRTLLFAVVVGLVLKLARVRDVATRLTAWTCVLYGALLLPAATTFLPPLAVPMAHRTVSSAVVVLPEVDVPVQARAASPAVRVDWRVALYLIVCMALLGRLAFGLMVARRLRRAALEAQQSPESSVLPLAPFQGAAAKIGRGVPSSLQQEPQQELRQAESQARGGVSRQSWTWDLRLEPLQGVSEKSLKLQGRIS